jgi:hypothetical protein
MLREGPTPIPEHRAPPVAFNRNEIVALVKEVLGDVDQIKLSRSSLMVRIYPGTRALRVAFSNGSHLLSEYHVPLPDDVIQVTEDAERNPYNMVTATVNVDQHAPAQMFPAAESSPGETA